MRCNETALQCFVYYFFDKLHQRIMSVDFSFMWCKKKRVNIEPKMIRYCFEIFFSTLLASSGLI